MDQKNSRLVFGIALVLLAGVIALAIGRPDLTASELGNSAQVYPFQLSDDGGVSSCLGVERFEPVWVVASRHRAMPALHGGVAKSQKLDPGEDRFTLLQRQQRQPRSLEVAEFSLDGSERVRQGVVDPCMALDGRAQVMGHQRWQVVVEPALVEVRECAGTVIDVLLW